MEEIYVVMPVYNAAKFLKKSISSVLRQSFSQFRLILVDDGSTDGSGRICDEYAAKDTRISVIHKENAGSFLARKSGVFQCADTGYITFLDADDRLLPDALQTFRDAVERTHADVVVGRMQRMWRTIVFPDRYYAVGDTDIDRELFFKSYFCSWYGITRLPVNLCGKLFRVDLLKQAYAAVPEQVTRFYGDDLLVTLHFFPLCEQIRVSSQAVYAYRMGGGTSRFHPEMLREFLSLYTYKLRFAENFETPQDLRLLSDIELCNVTYTFSRQLCAAPLHEADRRRTLEEALQAPQVQSAAQHVLQSDYADKRYAQWIADGDADAFLAAAQPTMRDKVQKIIFRFS